MRRTCPQGKAGRDGSSATAILLVIRSIKAQVRRMDFLTASRKDHMGRRDGPSTQQRKRTKPTLERNGILCVQYQLVEPHKISSTDRSHGKTPEQKLSKVGDYDFVQLEKIPKKSNFLSYTCPSQRTGWEGNNYLKSYQLPFSHILIKDNSWTLLLSKYVKTQSDVKGDSLRLMLNQKHGDIFLQLLLAKILQN